MDLIPYQRRAQYYETDMLGIIHHSNYIRWFEECRVDYLDQIGYPYLQVEASGISFPLLSLSCHYKSKVLFGDIVDIYCSISSLSKTRMSMSYRINDSKSKELRTTGETHHCFLRHSDNRPVSLERALPELFALFFSLQEQ